MSGSARAVHGLRERMAARGHAHVHAYREQASQERLVRYHDHSLVPSIPIIYLYLYCMRYMSTELLVFGLEIRPFPPKGHSRML
jgi:hypothetical protein